MSWRRELALLAGCSLIAACGSGSSLATGGAGGATATGIGSNGGAGPSGNESSQHSLASSNPGHSSSTAPSSASATSTSSRSSASTATSSTSSTTSTSSSSSTSSVTGPCDLYHSGGTPCVAAHSTVRALYGSYSGPIYQVRRASDNTTKDVPTLTPGGVANISVQNSFCSGTTCTISILYDQSPNHNDLVKSPIAHWLPNGGNESSATKGKTTVGGHTVYGIYVTGFSDNVAYRNNKTKGVATGNQAESMYMVVDGKRYSSSCCFDYGNAETDGNDDGNGTMEAIYWGTDTGWGGYGSGNGPWIAGDLENGMFKGNAGGWNYGTTHTTPWPTAHSVIANFATLVLKGPSDNTFGLKAGDAQSGSLTTMWSSSRPSPGYSPKSLQGAIILGTGGDGSNGGTGTFYEGAMTSGVSSDATDNAVQANIVAAGYGK